MYSSEEEVDQIRKVVPLAEFKSHASLLSQIETFRLHLLPRTQNMVEEKRLLGVFNVETSSCVWTALIHHSMGFNHYFAFVGHGMAVFSPVSDDGEEIQLSASSGLTSAELFDLERDVCIAIQNFGPMLDGKMAGAPVRVVPNKITYGFMTEGGSK